jgi:hypothetical protein
MGRHKIDGKEKCPHIGKDGKRCNKPGRYNPKPMVSWNNKRKSDKKREYAQFIHNDGTIHNIGNFTEYQLNKRLAEIKGHPSEQTLKKLYQLSSSLHLTADRISRVKDTITNWPMTQAEERDLINGLKYWIVLVEEMMKMPRIDLLDGKKTYDEIQNEMNELMTFLQKVKLLHENKIDPLAASLTDLFNKNERPARLDKRRDAQDRSQDLNSDRYQTYFIE